MTLFQLTDWKNIGNTPTEQNNSNFEIKLHPEEVLGVALGDVVDDVLVVEEGGVGGRLLRHALPVRHPRAAQLGELLGVRVRLA